MIIAQLFSNESILYISFVLCSILIIFTIYYYSETTVKQLLHKKCKSKTKKKVLCCDTNIFLISRFIIIFVFTMSFIMMTIASNLNGTQIKAGYCYSSKECYHGVCTDNICVCDKGYITWKNSEPCSYEQYSQLIVFLLSVFLG